MEERDDNMEGRRRGRGKEGTPGIRKGGTKERNQRGTEERGERRFRHKVEGESVAKKGEWSVRETKLKTVTIGG